MDCNHKNRPSPDHYLSETVCVGKEKAKMTDETAKELVMQLERIANALENIDNNLNDCIGINARDEKWICVGGMLDVRRVN